MDKILIAIEGIDGSGKATWAKKIKDRLTEQHRMSKIISFPDYDSPSGNVIRQYLNGDIKTTDPYTVGCMYALNRATFFPEWKPDYDNGVIIIADRYVESNFYYSAPLIKRKRLNYHRELSRYRKCFDYLEYEGTRLPRPNLTIYFNIDPEDSRPFRKIRQLKSGTDRDINEENETFLKAVNDAGKEYFRFIQDFRWYERTAYVIDIKQNNKVLSFEELEPEVYKIVDAVIKNGGDPLKTKFN